MTNHGLLTENLVDCANVSCAHKLTKREIADGR